MAEEPTIFVVDDDPAIRESLSGLLEASRYRTQGYGSAKDFLSRVRLNSVGCVIADIRMPDMDGLELQAEMNARASTLPVIIMTGHGDVPLAVRAMKAGAVDFLEKPYDTANQRRSKGATTAPYDWSEIKVANCSLESLYPVP